MTATMLIGPQAVADRDESWLAARRTGISASDMAAVLGLSPWQSPFSLYWSKVNGWESDENPDMRTGRYCEPAIVDWWADQNPGFVVGPAGLYASDERPWQLVTPDGLIYGACLGCDGSGLVGSLETGLESCPDCRYRPRLHSDDLQGVLECKWVAYSWDGWGEPETDDIPVQYRIQVLQAIDVMGVDLGHVAALGPDGFRHYLIRRDETDLRMMREAGRRFHERLVAGDPPPLDDAHTATIATLKKLHPSVSDVDVEVGVDLAEGYRRARAARSRADELVRRYEVRLRDAIGDGLRAVCVGNRKLVASRSVYDVKPHYREGHTVDRLNPGRSASYL